MGDSGDASTLKAPRGPRCLDVSTEPFMLGEGLPRPKAPPRDGAPDNDHDDYDENELVPYAVEVGRGTHFDGGFALGATRDEAGSAASMLAMVGLDGRGGRTVHLGQSRGDLDPPVVAEAGESVLVAMVEPNAGGRSIKIAKVTGSIVTWGPELAEGHDDSLAVDIAASRGRAIVVWDDVRGSTDLTRKSNVMLASLDVGTMRALTLGRPVSAPKLDAASPRLIPRPGGYWLAYLARDDEGAQKKPVGKGEDEQDDTLPGEAIVSGWVEVAPLDEAGTPTAPPKAVTSKRAHAVSFDIEAADGGGALLLVRDDDVPSGASGGRLTITFVSQSGISEARLVSDESESTGIPTLLYGWLAVASGTGATRIAPIGPRGELLGELLTEPSLGSGQPVASANDRILWARPAGKEMRLSVVRCARDRTGPGEGGPF